MNRPPLGVGLYVAIVDKRPVVTGVTVWRDGGDLKGAPFFNYPATKGASPAEQLVGLARALDSVWPAQQVAEAIVRDADYAASFARAPEFVRRRAEGALLVACASRVDRVHLMTGREIGEACGVSKDDADESGAALAGKEYGRAAAAAVAALLLSGN
jgi:hypothetical protein